MHMFLAPPLTPIWPRRSIASIKTCASVITGWRTERIVTAIRYYKKQAFLSHANVSSFFNYHKFAVFTVGMYDFIEIGKQ